MIALQPLFDVETRIASALFGMVYIVNFAASVLVAAIPAPFPLWPMLDEDR